MVHYKTKKKIMNNKQQIVVISNMDNNTFFFSTNHCQEHNLGDNYVPCTHSIPIFVEPRPTVPDGIVKSVADLINVFYDDMKQIDNPDKNYQPKF